MRFAFLYSENRIQRAKHLCVLLFLSLCLLHFFSQRPLWSDESAVLNNLQDKATLELLGPLDEAQAFPRVYLVLIKIFSQSFHYSLFSLRLFPLIAMVGAFSLWISIYKRIFGETWQWILGIFALTCSYYLSYYAGELKPYSMDVLTAGVFCLFILDQKRLVLGRPSRKSYVIVGLLPFMAFFSYAAFFMIGIVAYNFLFIIRENKRVRPLFMVYCAVSAVSLGLIYYFDLRHSFAEPAMSEYWDSYFICHTSAGCFFKTWGEGMRRLATVWFGKGTFFMQWATFLIPFFLYAVVRHGFRPWVKDRFRVIRIESLAFFLLMELFVLALFKKYPFTGERITLFLAPFILCVLIKAIYDLKKVRILFYFFVINFIILLTAGYVTSFVLYMNLYQS